jgi:hypothetical protein
VICVSFGWGWEREWGEQGMRTGLFQAGTGLWI